MSPCREVGHGWFSVAEEYCRDDAVFSFSLALEKLPAIERKYAAADLTHILNSIKSLRMKAQDILSNMLGIPAADNQQ
jgi:hypothetical protein